MTIEKLLLLLERQPKNSIAIVGTKIFLSFLEKFFGRSLKIVLITTPKKFSCLIQSDLIPTIDQAFAFFFAIRNVFGNAPQKSITKFLIV
jgi:hypothetical protein